MSIRRVCAALLAAFVLCAESPALAAQALYTAYLEEGTAVVDERGALFAPEAGYEYVYMVTGGDTPREQARAAAKTDGGELLIDLDGNALTAAEYSFFGWEEGYIVFCKEEKYGLMDEDGHVLCEGYGSLLGNGEGQFFALTGDPWDDTPDPVYLLNPQDGTRRETGVGTDMPILGGNGGLFTVHSAAQRAYGVMNSQGEWAVEPAFSWIGTFTCGYAPASDGGMLGVIDGEGRWVLEPACEFLQIAGAPEAPFVLTRTGSTVRLLTLPGLEPMAVYPQVRYLDFGEESVAVCLESELLVLDGAGGVSCRLEVPAEGEPPQLDLYMGPGRMALIDGTWGEACEYILDGAGNILSGPWQSVRWAGAEDRFLIARFDTRRVEEPSFQYGYLQEVEGTRRVTLTDGAGNALSGEYDAMQYVGGDLLLARDGDAYYILSIQDGQVLREVAQ